MSKPNTKTAMQQLIAKIQQAIPLNLNEAQMCQGECLGCSKKCLKCSMQKSVIGNVQMQYPA